MPMSRFSTGKDAQDSGCSKPPFSIPGADEIARPAGAFRQAGPTRFGQGVFSRRERRSRLVVPAAEEETVAEFLRATTPTWRGASPRFAKQRGDRAPVRDHAVADGPR